MNLANKSLEIQVKNNQEKAAHLQQLLSEKEAELDAIIERKDQEINHRDQEINLKDQNIKHKDLEIKNLTHRLNALLSSRYQKSSEKDDSRQQEIFDEIPVEGSETETLEEADETITVPSHTRKKTGRKKLPAELPRKRIEYDLSEAEKICECGCVLTRIGEETSEKLEIIPAQAYVTVHVRLKYACKPCGSTVKLAPVPKQALPKSIASPSLLAHTQVAKFCDHLPYYRQEGILRRSGIDLGRATLCSWTITCGELLLPLYKLLQAQIEDYDIAYADETPVQVLKEDGRSPTSNSYMWLFIGGRPDKRSIVYHYHPTRSGDVPLDFLHHFKGYLHVDAYSGYRKVFESLPITGVGCFAHARRKFYEITKAMKKKKGLANWAIKQFAKLYALEKRAKEEGLPPDKIVELRQKEAKPLLNEFKVWLDENIRELWSNVVYGSKNSLGGNLILHNFF